MHYIYTAALDFVFLNYDYHKFVSIISIKVTSA